MAIDEDLITHVCQEMSRVGLQSNLHTTRNDVTLIREKHIPQLIDMFGARDREKEITAFFDDLTNKLFTFQKISIQNDMCKKHACRIKDMLAIVTAFRTAKPDARYIINVGLYYGMSAMALQYGYPTSNVITIEPQNENIERFQNLNVESEMHTIILGTSLHSDNLPDDGRFGGKAHPNRLIDVLNDHMPELIFVDGDHHYDYCLAELELLRDHCIRHSRTMIIGNHDQQPGMPPREAVNDFIAKYNVRHFEFAGLSPRPPRVNILVVGP